METKISSGNLMTGMFPDRDSADSAYKAIHTRGYKSDEIFLIMSEDVRNKHFFTDAKTAGACDEALDGAGNSSAIAGTIATSIAFIGTTFVSGLDLVIAGPLTAAGTVTGDMAGGLVGALIRAGIPKERAIVYKRGIKEGNIFVGVCPKNAKDAEYIRNEWINIIIEITC